MTGLSMRRRFIVPSFPCAQLEWLPSPPEGNAGIKRPPELFAFAGRFAIARRSRSRIEKQGEPEVGAESRTDLPSPFIAQLDVDPLCGRPVANDGSRLSARLRHAEGIPES